MADFKKGFLYLGLAAGIGFGVGRATVRMGESRNNAKSQQSLAAKGGSNARKKKLKVKPASHQAPAIARPDKADMAVSDAPINALNDPRPLDANPASPDSPEANYANERRENKPAMPPQEPQSQLQPQLHSGSVAAAKPVETSDAPPKVRIYNAYRTRTFWTPGPIATDTQNFTVYIEREEGKNPAYKPRIDWQVGSARGTLWGDNSKKVQMITLPPDAWRLDRPEVEVEIKVGAAQEGRDFIGSPETATVTIKSLSQALASKGGLVHVSESFRQSNNGPGWVTSWNKVTPGAGTITIYVAPGTNPSALLPMISSAADFKVEPGAVPQGPMEIYASRDKILMGIVAGQVPPQTRNLIQRNRDILLTYRGLPQDYLGALQWDAKALAEKVKTNAIGDTVVLFRNLPGQPFGAVKRDLITIPNIEILRKEGIALFTKPVENIAYFAH